MKTERENGRQKLKKRKRGELSLACFEFLAASTLWLRNWLDKFTAEDAGVRRGESQRSLGPLRSPASSAVIPLPGFREIVMEQILSCWQLHH